MKALNSKSKGQVSLEYLIIMGIGLLILSAFLAYTFYYSSAYSATENGQNLALVVNSISGAVSYLSSQQTGSSATFAFDSPGLNILSSYLCNSYLILVSGGAEDASTLSLPIVGELPINPGRFSGQAKLVEIGGKQTTLLSFDLPVSFINASYAFNSSNTKILLYNLSFLSQSGAAVDDINFNITVYTIGGVQIASENESATSGTFYGTINLTKTYPEVKIIVSVPSLDVASSECFIPAQQLKITLLNSELTATPSPFQQMITINSSAYSKYEASNLQDIQFSYLNGTIIPSWLESGNIASFNGLTSVINSFKTNGLPTGTGTTVTVVAWIKPSAVQNNAGYNTIFETLKGGAPCSGTLYGLSVQSDLKPTISGCGDDVHLSSGASTANSWNFIALVLTGGKNYAVYVNGGPAINGAMPSKINASVTGFEIGGNLFSGSTQFFNGSIADVQVYSAALSSTQIAQLYAEGLGGAPLRAAGDVGWWPLAGNANDYSGNGNNGAATNVEFTGAGSASTDTTYWLKLGNGIPANSELSIYMDLYLPPYNLLNAQNTGEAPQLSPTYGEYDDGANVFTGYWNFAGSVIPSAFFTYTEPGATVSVSNGLSINTGSGNAAGIISNSGYAPPVISEADVTSQSGGALSGGIAQQTGNAAFSSGYDFNEWSGSIGEGSLSGGMSSTQNINLQTVVPGIDGQIWISSSAQQYYTNYAPHSASADLALPSTVYISAGVYCCSSSDAMDIQWFRVRAYPPDGVMPLVAIGGLT